MLKLGIFISLCVLLVNSVQARVLLTETDFMDALRKEFVEQGKEDNIELEFFGGQTSFVLGNANSAKIMISQLDIDEEQGRFTAKAEIFADGNPNNITKLTGRFFILGEVYVPAHDIAKGDVITDDKLEQKTVRLNRVKDGSVVTIDKLIGQQAKKKLKAGKIINEKEIGDLIIVQKGSLVTSVYRSKGLQITAQAVALQDGAKGQNIEVENSKSKKKFMATVVDADVVEIVAEE